MLQIRREALRDCPTALPGTFASGLHPYPPISGRQPFLWKSLYHTYFYFNKDKKSPNKVMQAPILLSEKFFRWHRLSSLCGLPGGRGGPPH